MAGARFLKVLFKQHFLFFLHCLCFSIMIILNLTKGYLITTTNESSKSQQLNVFGIAFGVADELFLVLYFIITARLHLNFGILRFGEKRNPILFAVIVVFQFGIFCPFQLLLITSRINLIFVFAFCYNVNQFFISLVILGYISTLFSKKKLFEKAIAQGSGSLVAQQCHRDHVKMFRTFSNRYGLLNLFVLMHAMLVVTIQANVILMYVFNKSYQHRGTIPRMVFTEIWLTSYVIKIGSICFASNAAENAWKVFERKLGQERNLYNLHGILMDQKFWATKCCVVNNKLFYSVCNDLKFVMVKYMANFICR